MKKVKQFEGAYNKNFQIDFKSNISKGDLKTVLFDRMKTSKIILESWKKKCLN